MATLQDLTRRIKSVSNTRKITKAMEMVAAAKLRRAQTRIETLRPFADNLVEMTVQVAKGIQGRPQHALLADREEIKSVCILMFGGDRGLSGAYNANVLRRGLTLQREWAERGADVRWIAVGRKGVGSLKFRGFEPDQSYQGFIDAPQFLNAQHIGHFVTERFSKGEYDKVIVVYNHFESAVQQTVVVADLLPISDAALRQATAHMHAVEGLHGQYTNKPMLAPTENMHISTKDNGHGDHNRHGDGKHHPDWFFEPDSDTLLDRLLPAYVNQSIFRALLESTASFFGSQMSAMRNASENASDIADQLTLQRNRARQAAITQEILEVVGGAEALN